MRRGRQHWAVGLYFILSSVVWETFADVNNTTLEEQSVGSKGVNHAKPWVRGLLLPQRNTDRNQN